MDSSVVLRSQYHQQLLTSLNAYHRHEFAAFHDAVTALLRALYRFSYSSTDTCLALTGSITLRQAAWMTTEATRFLRARFALRVSHQSSKTECTTDNARRLIPPRLLVPVAVVCSPDTTNGKDRAHGVDICRKYSRLVYYAHARTHCSLVGGCPSAPRAEHAIIWCRFSIRSWRILATFDGISLVQL